MIKIFLLIYVNLLFLELVFKLSITGFKMEYTQRIIVFTLAYALILLMIFRFIPRRIFKVFSITSVVLITFFYFAQDMYYRILSGFFSFDMASDAHKAIAFLSRVLENLTWIHALYLVPIIVGVLLMKDFNKKDFPKRYFFYNSYFEFFELLLIAFLMFMTVVHTIPKETEYYTNSPYVYTEYDFYREVPSAYQTINKFGLITYFQRDVVNKFSDESDYMSLYNEIVEYGETRVNHTSNIYTGYFEGKNLIMIMAESFDTFAIDPSLTPNIYHRLLPNSWYFDQFYAPLYYRNTADTEFMSQTGLYTDRTTTLTMEQYKDNYFPYTLPRLFNQDAYGTYAFHNYTDYFYPRSSFLPDTLGYDEYYDAIDFEMMEYREGVITRHDWQSDVDLIDQTMDVLSEKVEPFFSYILTVSGHLPYSDNHPIAEKNIDIIRQIFEEEGREIPSEDFLYYHAANYELDLAIGHLLDRLEEEGLADDTVVMLFGDHYAYGIDEEDIVDYDETKESDEYWRLQRVPMIIYHPNIIPKVKGEIFSSIDIMPTIANLFELDLDYRYIFGKDIFSNQRRNVFFSNGSMFTDEFYYDIEDEESIFYQEGISEEYIIQLVGEYIYRQKINQYILEIDYFRVRETLE